MADLRVLASRIFVEIISEGDLSLVEELIAEDYSDGRGPGGREGFRMGLSMVREAFPDWTSTIEETVVEGDRLAARWTVTGTHRAPFMGIPATGQAVQMQECGILHFVNGQLVAIRRVADELSLLRQLGVVPTP
jgi:steroid delta-isomerase-like uncharacterized protein